jgi:hypothetical protein
MRHPGQIDVQVIRHLVLGVKHIVVQSCKLRGKAISEQTIVTNVVAVIGAITSVVVATIAAGAKSRAANLVERGERSHEDPTPNRASGKLGLRHILALQLLFSAR